MPFELKLTTQCAKCPWKKETNPHEIPDGYSIEKHEALRATINSGLESLKQPLPSMACHHSYNDNEFYCIGWVHNQMGIGNNIGLRMKMFDCTNLNKLKIIGEQHANFEDTIPKK